LSWVVFVRFSAFQGSLKIGFAFSDESSRKKCVSFMTTQIIQIIDFVKCTKVYVFTTTWMYFLLQTHSYKCMIFGTSSPVPIKTTPSRLLRWLDYCKKNNFVTVTNYIHPTKLVLYNSPEIQKRYKSPEKKESIWITRKPEKNSKLTRYKSPENHKK